MVRERAGSFPTQQGAKQTPAQDLALKSKPLPGIHVRSGWKALSQKWGEKQAAPCTLPPLLLCPQQGAGTGGRGEKSTPEKQPPLPKIACKMVAGKHSRCPNSPPTGLHGTGCDYLAFPA